MIKLDKKFHRTNFEKLVLNVVKIIIIFHSEIIIIFHSEIIFLVKLFIEFENY